MTSVENRAFDTVPNVLRAQTAPNVLGGLAAPGPVARLRVSGRALVAVGVAVMATLAILLGREA